MSVSRWLHRTAWHGGMLQRRHDPLANAAISPAGNNKNHIAIDVVTPRTGSRGLSGVEQRERGASLSYRDRVESVNYEHNHC